MIKWRSKEEMCGESTLFFQSLRNPCVPNRERVEGLIEDRRHEVIVPERYD